MLIGIGTLLLGAFVVIRFFASRSPSAGLKIETNPSAVAFVDGTEIGKTPLEKSFPPKEVVVKLIPDSSGQPLSTYETKVRLAKGEFFTVIRRDFGPTDAESAGEIVTSQPQAESNPSLSVITSAPDSASVTVDGEPQGFTPLLMSSLTEGDHQITISAPGFTSRTITAQARPNYRLTLNVKLAASASTLAPTPTPTPATISATLSPSPRPGTPTTSPRPTARLSPTLTPVPTPNLPKPYVTILDTPVGFLRVRSGPGTGYSEVGQVKPGESYSLQDSSPSGWYLIEVELPATSSGWITSQYARKTE